jgi:hypothetical protein
VFELRLLIACQRSEPNRKFTIRSRSLPAARAEWERVRDAKYRGHSGEFRCGGRRREEGGKKERKEKNERKEKKEGIAEESRQ